LRAKNILEIGIWEGDSFVPMLIAARELTAIDGVARMLFAIDPWDANASVRGQNLENAQWWGVTAGADAHENACATFRKRVHALGGDALVTTLRATSTEAWAKHFSIVGDFGDRVFDLIHIDGNHGPQAIEDVRMYAPLLGIGGILVLDDLNWSGGAVRTARELAQQIGFRQLYELGTGVAMQKIAEGRQP
jgi:predicted O-methyltransferase YrrM